MFKPKSILILVLALLFGPLFGFSSPSQSLALDLEQISNWQDAPQTKVALISEAKSVVPGSTFSVALVLKPAPKWHLYWSYAGDSGAAPILAWSATNAKLIQPERFPAPQRIPFGPLVNYGYQGALVLVADFVADKQLQAGDKVDVKVGAEWLVCEEECIPGFAEISTTLTIGEENLPNEALLGIFEQTRLGWPISVTDQQVSVIESAESYKITFKVPPHWPQSPPPTVNFFPYAKGSIENAAAQPLTVSDGIATLLVTKAYDPPEQLTELAGVLVSTNSWIRNASRPALEIKLPLASSNQNSQPSGEQVFEDLQVGTGLEQGSFLVALLLAFLGGVILNLMPCVFPILSIKILSLVESTKHSANATKLHGAIFTLGVLCSFWVLAGAILILQAGGERLGWGFQLQSPGFVAFLALLMFTIGLNLMGFFEFGGSLQRVGDVGAAKSGISGAFWSGVLATVVATPCTAPFMGSAIAYALSLSAVSALLIFSSLALGVAAPFLLLSFNPRLLRFLPRPGNWMVIFKQLMAFPLFATALWLLWVLSLQSVSEVVLLQLLGAIGIAFALWVYSVWADVNRPKASRVTASLLTLIILSGSFALPIWSAAASTGRANNVSVVSGERDQYGLIWEEYSDQKVEQLVSQGHPVYVDFTAAWCITCQVNKRVVFSSSEVTKLIADKKIRLLRADWTNKDEKIARSLERYNRRGVPLNLLFSNHPEHKPYIFPAILTPGLVIEQLELVR